MFIFTEWLVELWFFLLQFSVYDFSNLLIQFSLQILMPIIFLSKIKLLFNKLTYRLLIHILKCILYSKHIYCCPSIPEGWLVQISLGLSPLVSQLLTHPYTALLPYNVFLDFTLYSCFRNLTDSALRRQKIIKFFSVHCHFKEVRILEKIIHAKCSCLYMFYKKSHIVLWMKVCSYSFANISFVYNQQVQGI